MGKEDLKSPYEKANIISRLFHIWLSPLFSQSTGNSLTINDVYKCPEKERAEYNTEELERQWESEISKSSPKLILSIIKSFKLDIFSSGFCLAFEILRLNQKLLAGSTTGQIINLLSIDAQCFDLTFLFVHYVWMGPLQALVVFGLMAQITLIPSLLTVGVIFLFIPIQSAFNREYAKMRFKAANVTDQRIRILQIL
ncbi:unnamed protein product [Heterobilharzia americana]|nr:unnamed protein product [Heterobilharzia americana]